MDEKDINEASGTADASNAPSPAPSRETEKSLQDDIKKILSEVKLPERNVPPASSEKKKVFDTQAVSALSGDTSPVDSSAPLDAAPRSKPAPTPPPALSVNPPEEGRPFAATAPPSTPEETPVSIPKIVTPPVTSPETNVVKKPSEKSAVPSLRTLKEDLQDIVKQKKVSLVRAVALEEEKKHKRDAVVADAPIHSHRSQKTLLIALALLVLGVLALSGVYVVMQSKAARSEPPKSAIIFAEQTMSLKLDNEPPGEVKRNLASLRSFTQLTLGAITRVAPTITVMNADGSTETREATLTEFWNAIGIPTPNDLTRSLADTFFFGIHVVDKNAPLLVIPVVSYERAFAAMLALEKDLNAHLTPIFTPVPPFMYDESGLLVERPFEDLVIRNYDVRALRDDGGNIELYYSFPTRNILIIAESTYSFTEILARLRAERKL